MVTTRAQQRMHEMLRQQSYQRGLRAREEWRRQQRNAAWFDAMGRLENFRKQYRPNDRYHRHRLPDAQPKTQRVVSYTRRT